MDYQMFVKYCRKLIACYKKLNKDAIIKIGPCANEESIKAVEEKIGIMIPIQLRDFFLDFSAEFEISATLPCNIREKLPQELSKITKVKFAISLGGVEQSEIIRRDSFNPDNETDSVWCNKLGIIEVGNGDVISLDVSVNSNNPPVVYLSPNYSHSIILGKDFNSFILNLVFSGGCGMEFRNLSPFISNSQNGIDHNCDNAKTYRSIIHFMGDMDDKLIDLLWKYRSVFAPQIQKDNPCNAEKEIVYISSIGAFATKINKDTPRSDNGKLNFQIAIFGSTFDVIGFERKSIQEEVERACNFNVRLKDAIQADSTYESKLAKLLAVCIIAMLLENNIEGLQLPVKQTIKKLSLSDSIEFAVRKMTEWLLYDPNDPKTIPQGWNEVDPGDIRLEYFDKYIHDLTISFKEIKNPMTSVMWYSCIFKTKDGETKNNWHINVDEEIMRVLPIEFRSQTSSISSIQLEKKLQSAAMKQMIYRYLLGKHNDEISKQRATDILRENVTIIISASAKGYNASFSFRPPISHIISTVNRVIEDIVRENMGNIAEYRALLRFLAENAKRRFRHEIMMTKEVYQELIKTIFNNDLMCEEDEAAWTANQKKIDRMLVALQKYNILICNKKRNSFSVMFNYKDHRLLFEGAYLAYQFGLKKDKVGNQIDVLEDFLQEDWCDDVEQSTRNHLNLRFNRYVVVGISFLINLDDGNRERAIERLLSKADDFSVINRSEQIKAIFLLSYFLYDGTPIPTVLRNRIFKSTFGTVIYPFMYRETRALIDEISTKYVLNTDNEFISIMKNTLLQSCILEADKESNKPYSKAEPFYIFWGGFLKWKQNNPAIQFLIRNVFKTQRIIWEHYEDTHIKFKISQFEKICKALFETLSKMQDQLLSEKANEQILPWVWAANMLLFSIADYRNFMHQENEFLQYANKNEYLQNFVQTAVLCDYFTRKYNRGYNNNGVDSPNVFLLCGAFRFVCCYSLLEKENSPIVQLTEDMINDYCNWFKREKQIRYKVLICRLLSYTSYPIDELKQEIIKCYDQVLAECKYNWDELFLAYDRIPEINQFIEYPRMLKPD